MKSKELKFIRCSRCGAEEQLFYAKIGVLGTYCSEQCQEEYERPHPKTEFKGTK
jgi:hypothetical protein